MELGNQWDTTSPPTGSVASATYSVPPASAEPELWPLSLHVLHIPVLALPSGNTGLSPSCILIHSVTLDLSGWPLGLPGRMGIGLQNSQNRGGSVVQWLRSPGPVLALPPSGVTLDESLLSRASASLV